MTRRRPRSRKQSNGVVRSVHRRTAVAAVSASSRYVLVTPTLDALRAMLDCDGMHALLAALNGRTRYRFTGIYRVDPPLLRNVALHDRENPIHRLGGDINTLDETFCATTVSTAGPLVITDAPADARFAGHAACAGVHAYLGVPIRHTDGHVFATLCHFDPRPRLAPLGEHELLTDVAAMLAERIAVS